ncbi:tRNA (N(6)-L-threonylcarbamoyladenosine(37)-C(2))-methylthiotransferase MtaB [Sphaerochaeta sp. PS]|uniref:tRNA (N(6)-L-threonylcarbamoyladenosine(37)-C(2))- methylthiotransferase MtaB n=1 Tax=Sphaerochaeta sp. PS TaxID=3076336 RepID=UPI0028A31D48|nr:tRNA (N(6)-L-threonylcarbamoyladenosine(37)-C(2))-methylthiotransferase MtaB [Sphaerochaeta sp. PS]MDT4762358.1 tRNA (N(6)-L-threonylcarbamoyladenosine(37)-C(2))-methylthiotransferase MtaB [Sphaerochaeta sp. PS]
MNVCVYTLGCRLNQCESEAIADSFSQEGFTIVGESEQADLYIVNTCTVTSKAEQKARRMIRKFALSGVVLGTGCYAQVNEEELKTLSDNVIVVPLEKKAHLLKLAKHLKASLVAGFDLKSGCLSFSDGQASVFDYDAASFSYHSRSFLKVQDGCDNECAYCRVHIARGKAVSLDSATVVQRALALEAAGFSEIMLTGVNLTMYDHTHKGLGGLLEELLAELGPDIRLRLSSLEPDHIDERLLATLSDPRMQPHFHIPVQSASNKVLSRVNRHYDIEGLSSILDRLRLAKDDPFIAADVITGLPGEGDEEFEETFRYFSEQQFAQMHVFPFSPRPDTPLFKASDRVPESLRDSRALRLRELSDRLYNSYVQRQIGKEAEVILQNRKAGSWYGLSGNYLEVKVPNAPLFAREGLLVRGVFAPLDEGTGKPIVLCHA